MTWGSLMHLDRKMKEAAWGGDTALMLPRARVKIICGGENTKAVKVLDEWFCERCGHTVQVAA